MDTVYDKALIEVGDNGLFQKRFDVIYNILLSIFWTSAYMNLILVLVVIPHTCQPPEISYHISDEVWKLKYLPIEKNISGNLQFSSCLILNEKNKTVECEKYIYDTTWYGSTVPSENDWVCDKELYVANIFAYTRIAEVIGSFVFGWLGDKYGRKFTCNISIVFLVVGRTISIFARSSYVMFTIGCIIACFPSWSVMQCITVISIEMSSPERRTTSTTYRFIAAGVGLVVLPLLYWWLREWRLLMTVTTATLLPFILFSGKLIESPRWLWMEGKNKSCVKILKLIAKKNNRKLNDETENEILTSKPIDFGIQNLGPLALFSSCRLALNTMLQLLMWIPISITYNVILMSTGEKTDGNPFLEFAWQSLAEIPSNIIGAWLADKIGRRYTGVASFAVSFAMSSLTAYSSYTYTSGKTWLHSWWVDYMCNTINRLSISVAYYAINLFNMELYPTCLRQSGMSIGNISSAFATGLAPYIVYLGRRFAAIPGVIMTIMCFIGGISSYMLPETLKQKLPETLEDAKTFGNKKYHAVSKR